MAPKPTLRDGAAGSRGTGPFVRTRVVQWPSNKLVSSEVARWQAFVMRNATSNAIALKIPPNRAQPPSEPAWQKERSRHQDALEIQRTQLSRIAHPVIQEHRPSGIRNQSLQRQNEDEQIVDFAEKWDVIWNEVHWHPEVRDRAGHQQLVGVRNTAVGQQSTEKSQEIRQILQSRHYGALRAGPGRRSRRPF